MPEPFIRLRHVSRRYQAASGGEGSGAVAALEDVSLDLAADEFTAITGPSGCGKSTLLHLLAGLDRPTAGEIFVGDLALHSAGEDALTSYRRKDLGIVFQFFNLLPTMSVEENVCLPLLLAGEPLAGARSRAEELLDLVGLGARRGHFVHQLSGGEMQRTAIARALVHRPRLLLADEPTGNLDSAGAARVLEVFRTVAAQALAALVVVTHSEEVAGAAKRRVRMRDGRIEATGQ